MGRGENLLRMERLRGIIRRQMMVGEIVGGIDNL